MEDRRERESERKREGGKRSVSCPPALLQTRSVVIKVKSGREATSEYEDECEAREERWWSVERVKITYTVG